MRDNRRGHRTSGQATLQWYRGERKGDMARMLTPLGAMVSGIVVGESDVSSALRKFFSGVLAFSNP